jgi:hypothetical protein
MKFILKTLLFLVLFYSFVFSQDDIKSKELYISYDSYPKRVFTSQKFDIKLKVIILKPKEEYDKILTTFFDEKNIQILTKDPIWIEEKPNNYVTTLTFKANDTQFIMPKITIALIKGTAILNFILAKSIKIKFEKIAINQKHFSGIIAKDLQILTIKTKQYTNNMLHSAIHISSTNSNLEDINLTQYADQGIKDLTDNYPDQSIYFYVMTPSHTKRIRFTYYNTVLKDFVYIKIPINLDTELVSTQSDLNPYNSSILIYKQILFGILLFFAIFLYTITKQNRYLIIITIFIIIIAYLFIPNKKTILKNSTKVYILPTKNSTIFKVLDKKELVEIINKKDIFVKVLFLNQNIGWVKENDIK